jgi:CubicO group peptidase (beta-lactamase class C family)
MRLPLRPLLALLLFCWPLAFAPPARPADVPQPPKTFDLKAIDEYVAGQVQAKGFVGLSLALSQDGKLVFAKGYGKRSLQPAADVDADTPFAVGSVTKQFTCACILLLAEEGKLSVDDRVAKYYPELTRARDVTLYDLMTHASGYPDYYPLDFVDRRLERAIAPDKLIGEYAGGKLDFEPGTRWSYSNTGYTLLGRVVEKVSGEPLGKFLERRILKPVGMTHSALDPDRSGPGLARGYTAFALGDPEPAPPEADGWLYAAGGLHATATDLARWDLALMEGKVLKPESFRLMTTPRRLADGRTKDYGCGLNVGQRNGEAVFRHGGAISGFHATNAMIPRTRSAVVLLSNVEHIDSGPLHGEILSLLLKGQARTVQDVPKVDGPPAKEAALELFRQMHSGEIDRSKLGEDFSHYMSKERVEGAKDRLKAMGEPEKVEVEGLSERGGMEVASLRLTFKGVVVKALLYRTPDGKIQEFLLTKG